MWKIKLHKDVVIQDLKSIDNISQKIILKTINKKLSIDHYQYGEALRFQLKGYFKLKVSGYRVIYKISNEEIIVLVLKIGIRKDSIVYKEMIKRLKK